MSEAFRETATKSKPDEIPQLRVGIPFAPENKNSKDNPHSDGGAAPGKSKADAATMKAYEGAHPGVVLITRTDWSKEQIPEPFRKALNLPDSGDAVSNKYEHGSGFFYDKDGDIITNAHVVAPDAAAFKSQLTVRDENGKEHPAHIVSIDPSKDLAKIKLDDGPLPDGAKVLPLAPDDKSLKPGDPLYGVGHPHGVRDTYISPGTYIGQGNNAELEGKDFDSKKPDKACVAKATGDFTGPDTYDAEKNKKYLAANQYEAKMHLEPGNSGGPVVDNQGDVRAVAVKKAEDYKVDLIPSADVRKFAESPSSYKFGYEPDPARPGAMILTKIEGPPNASPVVPSYYGYLSQKCSPTVRK